MLTIALHASDFFPTLLCINVIWISFILKKNARTMQNQHRVEHFKITNEKPTLS